MLEVDAVEKGNEKDSIEEVHAKEHNSNEWNIEGHQNDTKQTEGSEQYGSDKDIEDNISGKDISSDYGSSKFLHIWICHQGEQEIVLLKISTNSNRHRKYTMRRFKEY